MGLQRSGSLASTRTIAAVPLLLWHRRGEDSEFRAALAGQFARRVPGERDRGECRGSGSKPRRFRRWACEGTARFVMRRKAHVGVRGVLGLDQSTHLTICPGRSRCAGSGQPTSPRLSSTSRKIQLPGFRLINRRVEAIPQRRCLRSGGLKRPFRVLISLKGSLSDCRAKKSYAVSSHNHKCEVQPASSWGAKTPTKPQPQASTTTNQAKIHHMCAPNSP